MAVHPEDIEQAEFELQIDQQNLADLRAERATLTDPADIELLDNAIADAESDVSFRQNRLDNLQNDRGFEQSARGQTAGDSFEDQTTERSPGEGSDQFVDPFAPGGEELTEEEQQRLEQNNEDLLFGDEDTEVSTDSSDDDEGTVSAKPGEVDSETNPDTSSDVTTVADSKIVSQAPDRSAEQKSMSQAKVVTRNNILHDYASYTYRATLYVLSREDHAALVDDPESFVPRHVLISSGGGYPNSNTKPGRHPDFQEDFFIDNINIKSVVGLNAKSKSSNALGISFKITEPYGLTLLDRLMSACMSPPINGRNYIEQPYLLEIDFLSNASTAHHDGFIIDRKRLPIKFVDMKIRPGTSGSEYQIEAIPYNHSAFQDSNATTPVNLQVEAQTVGDFFDAKNTDLVEIFKDEIAEQNKERAEADLEKWLASQPSGGINLSQEAKDRMFEKFLGQQSVLTNSYPASFNSFYRSVAGKNTADGDKKFKYPPIEIAFNIADEFADSKIVDPTVTETRTLPMTKLTETPNASWGGGTLKTGRTIQVFPVKAGSNIVNLIDRVMQASEYITNQVKSFQEAQEKIANNQGSDELLDEFKYLNWYKIIPQVFIREFDPETNAYSKLFVYSVIPYRAANAYHPDFAKTKIARKSVVRSYNYWYTGKNTDIIDLNIEFNTAFYTALTAFQGSKTKGGGASRTKDELNKDSVARTDNKDTKTEPSKSPDLPYTVKPIGSNLDSSGQMNRQDNPKSIAVSDMAKSLYSNLGGDMLNITMRIAGDPAYIKQDDVYYNPAGKGYKKFSGFASDDDAPIRPESGQIAFDNKQVFVQLLTGKIAVDINDKTGITNKQVVLQNGRKTNSTFSGVYKVLTVDSQFNQGRFEQTITMIKMPNDLFDSDDEEENTDTSNVNITTSDKETAVETPENTINFIDAGSVQGTQPEQTATNVLGIQGNDLSKLQTARDSNPDSMFPIVNGAGTPETPAQPTQSSPANINDTNVDIPPTAAFVGTAQNTNQGQN